MHKEYDIVIGLEIHVELQTNTKIFCSCKNEFGGKQNSHVCQGCAGFPGVLPIPNKHAFELAIRAGLALNCEINNLSRFERKHYFYADLPDAYQLTQNDQPICMGGHVDINCNDYDKRIRLNHIHLEEDAGKLVHDGLYGGSGVDLNRSAVPLIEIVTEPDFSNANEVVAFLEKVKSTMQYLGVSDCKMQEGSMRCDVNVSVKEKGTTELGIRTEMKNMSSFSNVVKAIEYESNRHIELIENGETVKRQTRGWNEAKNETFALRSKEDAHDYRYFPEPNIPPVFISDEQIKRIKDSQPKLAQELRMIFIEKYSLPDYDAQVLTQSKYIANFFQSTVELGANAKTASNWIMMDVLRLLKEKNKEPAELVLQPEQMFKLIKLVEEGKINQSVAKGVLEEIFENDKDPEKIVEEKGLLQINDQDEILSIVKEVISKNMDAIEKYKAGNTKALAAVVGQTMKATKGKANPKLVNELILKEIQ